MFQCIYKNIGAEELRGAILSAKLVAGLVRAGIILYQAVGRFGGLAQNEITSVAGDSRLC